MALRAYHILLCGRALLFIESIHKYLTCGSNTLYVARRFHEPALFFIFFLHVLRVFLLCAHGAVSLLT